MAGENTESVMSEEELADRERQRILALDTIGGTLEGLKETAVRWRAEYEMQWTEDFEQYNTTARSLSPSKREGAAPPVKDDEAYRQTADNITRPKVIITASRLGDMLFPTNEANWDLDSTPKPEIDDHDPRIPPPPPTYATDPNDPNQQVEQPPQPYTPDQLMEQKLMVARKACGKMKTTIDDQLSESKYDEAGRATIFDGCLYGTGVLRGPVLKSKRRHTPKSQGGTGYQVQMVQEAKPTAEYVDLWSFFPQPCRNIDECEHAFVLHVLPPRAIRKLARQPGFDSAQIARLLQQQPSHGALVTGALDRGAVRPDMALVLADRYAVWEFRGPMPKDAFAAFVAGLVANKELKPDDAADVLKVLDEDHLNDIDCEVWFSQGIVLKMALSTLEPGELGFYVFNYEKNPNSIFGRGVAYLCRDDQHATNQLWHAMMLNSMMSAGPQIGVRKDSLVPQPGRANTLAADKPRVWALNDDVEDIGKAFSVFTIPNVTKDIMLLYERTKQNADEHTMIPLVAQGEATSAVPTSSGMAMLMNAANVVMRRLAKTWDDQITVPLIGAFYDWNMVNNEDPEIRGDYCVIPKGASHLLIKDIQTQHLQFATQLFATNPMLTPYMKPGVFARKNVEMLDMSADELLYTDEQVAENAAKQGQQPDPETIKAQAAMATAQAQQARAEAESQATMRRIDLEESDSQRNHEVRMADIQARTRIQEMQLQVSNNQVAQAFAQMDQDGRLEMQKIIADLTKEGAKVDLKQYEVDSRAATEAARIASAEAQARQDREAGANQNPKVP